MDSPSRYTRDSEDAGPGEDVGMLSEKVNLSKSPQLASNKTAWWKYAIGGVVLGALFIPAVGYTSSVLLERRVNAAVEAALANVPTPATVTVSVPVTTTAQPSHTASSSSSNSVADTHHVALEEDHDLLLSNGTTIRVGNPMGGQRMEIKGCGSNADEARRLGCAYDVMMQEWTAPECIDWALSEKFLKQYNWTWYANSDASRTLNATEVALGNHDVVYVDQSYHRAHCIFTWEKTVRALRTQRPLVSKLTDYDHVMHCKMNTLRTFEEGAEQVRGVVAPTVFTTCASLDVWLENLPGNTHSSVDRLLKML